MAEKTKREMSVSELKLKAIALRQVIKSARAEKDPRVKVAIKQYNSIMAKLEAAEAKARAAPATPKPDGQKPPPVVVGMATAKMSAKRL